MPACSLRYFGGTRFPSIADNCPQGRSKVGRGFHPKRKKAV